MPTKTNDENVINIKPALIRITGKDENNLQWIKESIDLLDQAIRSFYEQNNIDYEANKPKLCSLRSGSAYVEIVLPIACALLPVAYDIIKTIIENNNRNVELKTNNGVKWTWEDDYLMSKAVLKEYVIKKKNTTPTPFARKIKLSKNYSDDTKIAKLHNIKSLIEKYNLENTLNLASRNNYSKQNKRAFLAACEDLGITI